MDSKALATLTPQEMMQRVDKAKWPAQLQPREKELIAEIALSYGLDPIMNELTLYQGSPYVTIGGRTRKAQENPKYDGLEGHFLSKDEKEAMGFDPEEVIYEAKAYVKGLRVPYTAYGRANPKSPIIKNQPVEREHPHDMAKKRAEHKVLRSAFALNLPGAEEIGDPSVPPEIAHDTSMAVTETGRIVNRDTGEIIEGEGRVIQEGTGEIQPAPEDLPLFPEDPKPELATDAKKEQLEKMADVRGRLTGMKDWVKKQGWEWEKLTVEQAQEVERQLKRIPEKE